MADVPPGGVPWSVFTPTMRSAIEYWAGVEGVPVQAMMNIIWRESGTGSIANGTARIQDQAPTHGRGVYGPAGLNQNTYTGVGVTNPHDESQAAMGLARIIHTYGTGGVIHDDTYQLGKLPFDMNRAAVFYNWGPGKPETNSGGRYWESIGRDNRILPNETRTYWENISRGIDVAPPSVGTQGERSLAWDVNREAEQLWRLNDESLGLISPLGQVSSADQWGHNLVGDFWAARDPEYRHNLQQQLGQGPTGILGQVAPWDQPGIISPEYGHYLKTQGLMPSNLEYDFTNTTWNAPAGSQPGWWGPWGAESVHNWAQEGVSHGYGQPFMSLLGNLNYNLVDPGLPAGSEPLGGAPFAATGGVDLAHWIAQKWGGSWGSGNAMDQPRRSNVYDASNMFPGDMQLPWDPQSPRELTFWERPELTFWDASPISPTGVHVIDQPTGGPGQPSGGNNVLNWVPAGGDWGIPGGVGPYAGWAEQNAGGNTNLFFNPALSSWGTFSGGGGLGHEVEDYNQWYQSGQGVPAPATLAAVPRGELWTDSTIQSSGPGYGAALNPIFGGMYYSQVPSAQDAVTEQMQADINAHNEAFNNAVVQSYTNNTPLNFVTTSGQTINTQPYPVAPAPTPGPTPGAPNIFLTGAGVDIRPPNLIASMGG